MAVGDAMGLSAKSMKPETIQQLFGSMNSFKDVRPFIGKGIKRLKCRASMEYRRKVHWLLPTVS